MQEIDDLAVARESDVEGVIADWEARADERVRSRNAQMVDRVISEHRAERNEI
jgi:predicted RNase H-like nuclease (RuvC/YqgF family)